MIRRIFRRIVPSKTFLALLGIQMLSTVLGLVTTAGTNTSMLLWAGTVFFTGRINTRSSTPVSFIKQLIVIPLLSRFLINFTIMLATSMMEVYLSNAMSTQGLLADACYTFVNQFVPLHDAGVLQMIHYCNDLHKWPIEGFASRSVALWRDRVQYSVPLFNECMRLRSSFATVSQGQCPAQGAQWAVTQLPDLDLSYLEECLGVAGLLDVNDDLVALFNPPPPLPQMIPKMNERSRKSKVYTHNIDFRRENETFMERHMNDFDIALSLADL